MKKVNFNENWIFIKDGKEERINLPHDAMMYEYRKADSPLKAAGGYYVGGVYKYKKTFTPDFADNLLVEFEGIQGEAFVYLNGKLLCVNEYGYHTFAVDLTKNAIFGKENTLEVLVKNDNHINSRWYSGSGIYRSVNLYTGKKITILRNGVRITTPDVAEDISKVEIALDLSSQEETNKEIFILTEITDEKGKTIYTEKTPFTFFGKEEVTARIRLYPQNVRLWSVENPYLYTAKITLTDKDGEKIVDEVAVPFGIRKFTLDPLHGLRLNGQAIKLRGACIHHDNGVIGARSFLISAERQIKKLKEAGFNSVRISHHPASVDILDACDKLGMLVWDETFDMWEEAKNPYDFSLYFDRDWKAIIDETVAKDYNHPSVFIYCIGNEIPEIIQPKGIKITRELSDRLREKDPTRFVTNALNGLCCTTGRTLPILLEMGLVTKEQIKEITGDENSDNTQVFSMLIAAAANGNINDAMTALASNLGRVIEHESVGEKLAEPLSFLDVGGYNYMRSRYKVDKKSYPNLILVGSETMPPDIDINWEDVKEMPNLIGDYTWTGWDYIGEAGVGHTNYEGKKLFAADYPGYLAYCGDLDITGYRRPMSYLREIVFGLRKAPYLSVQHPKYYGTNAVATSWAEPETIESWTFDGYEGKAIQVKVYSCDEEIALFLNGKEVGRKKVERNRATFDIIYQKGELTAIGYTKGEKQESHTLITADKDVSISVTFSKDTLEGINDLIYGEIELKDKKGITNTDISPKIKVETENCELLGMGSGDPCSTENFFENIHTTFNGRLLFVIRATQEGKGVIKITSEGLKPVTKEIKVVL